MKFKRLLTICLAGTLVFQVMTGVCYAAEPGTVVTEDIETRQVIDRIQISASECKEMYLEMEDYNGWTSGLASILVGFLGPLGGVVGGITTIASLLQSMNYTMVKNELKEGWQSGKGCTMIIYDNAQSTIWAN